MFFERKFATKWYIKLCIKVKPIVRNRVRKFAQVKNRLFWMELGT